MLSGMGGKTFKRDLIRAICDALRQPSLKVLLKSSLDSDVHSATAKTSLVAADEFGFWDSVSGLMRKISWANILATIGNWLQLQTAQAFTTAGTNTTYTLTPTPAIAANSAGLRFRVSFHVPPGASPNMAISGKPPLSLKYKDATGTKQTITPAQVPSGWISDVECDGTDHVVLNIAPPSSITLGTAVATTSGSSIDFTGIPAGAKRITISWDGLSSNGTSVHQIQLGTSSGGVETTGYSGSISFSATQQLYTTGFKLETANLAAENVAGQMILTLLDPSTNTWVEQHQTGDQTSGAEWHGAGSKSLSGILDRVRLTTANGTDTFDAGKANISYEV